MAEIKYLGETGTQELIDKVKETVDGMLPLSGGTMSGEIDMGGEDITNAGNITANKVVTPKITAEDNTNIQITNTFETNTYSSVVDTIKLNSAGFDISGISTKAEDGSVLTNQIKTSNSKMTVNANDLEINNEKTTKVVSGGNFDATADAEINLTAGNTASLSGYKVAITARYENLELSSNSNVEVNAGEDLNITSESINMETLEAGDIKIISPYIREANGADTCGTIRLALTNMDAENLTDYRSGKIYIGKDDITLGMLDGRDMDGDNTNTNVTKEISRGINVTEESVYLKGKVICLDKMYIGEDSSECEAVTQRQSIEQSLATYFSLQKTGKIYQTKVYKYASNPTSAGEKLLDNEGLVFEPSTDTAEGEDDYAEIPLFQWWHCNYVRDENGDPYITAIKGDSDYAEEGLVDVGAMGMTFYVNVDESNEEYDLWTISDSPNEELGLVPWCESVRADGSVAPYWCHSAFFSTTDTEDGLPRSLPYKRIEEFVSYNTLLTGYTAKGDGYKGAGACRQLFGQIFSVIMTGSKNSQSSMYGVYSWNFQYTAAEESEEENTYFPVTAAQASNLEVGLCVSVGYTSSTGSADRGGANMYAYAHGVKITAIEQQDDDLYYVYLDVEEGFPTAQVEVADGVTSQIYMSSWHCYTGMTNDVIGKHNGSPVSNTDGKHPFRIQGTEYACGAYMVASDTVLYTNEDYSKTVYTAAKGVSRSSTQSVIESTYTKVGTIPAKADGTGGYYFIGDMTVNEELGVSYPSGEGGSNSTGYADYLYSNTSTGLKEYVLGGCLSHAAGGGLYYVLASYALSQAPWNHAACD